MQCSLSDYKDIMTLVNRAVTFSVTDLPICLNRQKKFHGSEFTSCNNTDKCKVPQNHEFCMCKLGPHCGCVGSCLTGYPKMAQDRWPSCDQVVESTTTRKECRKRGRW